MVLTEADILKLKAELDRAKKESEVDEEHMKVRFHFNTLIKLYIFFVFLGVQNVN